jgi:two-component system sensor histidine kinase PilS (NtrC family)
LRFVERHAWLVELQLAADVLLVSAFIYITGGVASYFSSLYLLPIIAASAIRFRRGALQVAALTTVAYFALVVAQYLAAAGLWPGGLYVPAVALPTARFAQYTVAINLSGFLAVAALSGWLAEGLRSAGKRLEHASIEMADLRAFNEDVIDSLLSGLITTDAERRILTFNRGAASITGVAVAEAAGRDAADVLQLPAADRARLDHLRHTRCVRLDLEYQTGDGRRITLGLTVSTLAFPDGRAGCLYTFQDVTELRRLERDARLQQRLAAVGEMAAGIAHEIRNPLASISGSMQVLRQELLLNDEQAALMDIVLRESDRLNDTISSFLAYARPQRLAVSTLDVRKAVQDTAVLLRNSPDVRPGHVVDVDVPDAGIWYEADENQLRQVIWNLASNGLRAMPAGGRLLLAASHEPATGGGSGHVVLTVQDEGCGIPADQLDAIFQPFHSSFDRGTGLGLSIVHRVVTDGNGTVQVSSSVGVGTNVRVRLPITASSTPAAGAGQVRRMAEA